MVTNAERSPALFSVENIDKRFPGVQALKGVHLDVRGGEVLALVGENGAGKSTLMHILAGVYRSDSGTIYCNGSPVEIRDEHEAQRLGISVVYQERSLVPELSIAENIFAARQPVSCLGTIKWRKLYEDSAALLRRVGLPVDPRTRVGALAPAQQQMVEIAKALSLKVKLLILDEPTATITEDETETLFGIIRQLRSESVAVIYISHRLAEIFVIADRVSVLKDGRAMGSFPIGQTSPRDLVRLMVGRDLAGLAAQDHSSEDVLLSVEHLEGEKFHNISFALRRGEILALAGLTGAGRTEVARGIFGADPTMAGVVRVNGKVVKIRAPADAVAAGIAYLSEDRKQEGLFLDMSVRDNIAAAAIDSFGNPWWINDPAIERVAESFKRRLNIAATSLRQRVVTLSGGNQQKAALARWLLVEPKVLIVDEPTRGIDVGAKAEVYRIVQSLAASGVGVILISSDLPEVLSVSNRILVMCRGRIAGEFRTAEATEEAIIHCAAGLVHAGESSGASITDKGN